MGLLLHQIYYRLSIWIFQKETLKCKVGNDRKNSLIWNLSVHHSYGSMLTLTMLVLVLLNKRLTAFSHFWYFNAYFIYQWTNTRHVCTYLNAFLMVIPNKVMKFHTILTFLREKKMENFGPVTCCTPAGLQVVYVILLLSTEDDRYVYHLCKACYCTNTVQPATASWKQFGHQIILGRNCWI